MPDYSERHFQISKKKERRKSMKFISKSKKNEIIGSFLSDILKYHKVREFQDEMYYIEVESGNRELFNMEELKMLANFLKKYNVNLDIADYA